MTQILTSQDCRWRVRIPSGFHLMLHPTFFRRRNKPCFSSLPLPQGLTSKATRCLGGALEQKWPKWWQGLPGERGHQNHPGSQGKHCPGAHPHTPLAWLGRVARLPPSHHPPPRLQPFCFSPFLFEHWAVSTEIWTLPKRFGDGTERKQKRQQISRGSGGTHLLLLL